MTPDFPDKPLSETAGRRLDRATDTAYRLRGGETSDEGVRRVAHGRVEAALGQLRREAKVDVATAVHDARKDLKKLRSLQRLVRADLGKQRYRAENGRYRDAARLLSSPRDAEVKLETLAGLREAFPDELPAMDGLRRVLEDERERLAGDAGDPELAGRLEQAAAAIAAGGAEVDAWELAAADFELLRAGIERSYRRGRNAFRALGDDPSDEAVHELRKRVKDLWYHLRLLRDVWPATMKGAANAAHELSDLLGEHNDLAVLAADARARAPDDPDLPALVALAERRQRELLDAALPLGERLYAEKPKRYADRLASYWYAWRSGDGA
jgi:CHAD domain-containing protein